MAVIGLSFLGGVKLLPGVPSTSPGSVRAAESEPKLSSGVPLVSMGTGGVAFAFAVCPLLEKPGPLAGRRPGRELRLTPGW